MGHLVNPESAGKKRARVIKEVTLAIRELAKQSASTPSARDMAAFIALTLEIIKETVDVTVLAWEKRNYWVKADRFRMEWEWAESLGKKMRKAVLEEDWEMIVVISSQIAERLWDVRVSDNHRLGTPWTNAWQVIQKTPS